MSSARQRLAAWTPWTSALWSTANTLLLHRGIFTIPLRRQRVLGMMAGEKEREEQNKQMMFVAPV